METEELESSNFCSLSLLQMSFGKIVSVPHCASSNVGNQMGANWRGTNRWLVWEYYRIKDLPSNFSLNQEKSVSEPVSGVLKLSIRYNKLTWRFDAVIIWWFRLLWMVLNEYCHFYRAHILSKRFIWFIKYFVPSQLMQYLLAVVLIRNCFADSLLWSDDRF